MPKVVLACNEKHLVGQTLTQTLSQFPELGLDLPNSHRFSETIPMLLDRVLGKKLENLRVFKRVWETLREFGNVLESLGMFERALGELRRS